MQLPKGWSPGFLRNQYTDITNSWNSEPFPWDSHKIQHFQQVVEIHNSSRTFPALFQLPVAKDPPNRDGGEGAVGTKPGFFSSGIFGRLIFSRCVSVPWEKWQWKRQLSQFPKNIGIWKRFSHLKWREREEKSPKQFGITNSAGKTNWIRRNFVLYLEII